MTKSPIQRISITIAPELLRRADRLARLWDRSRSWVLAEAVRRLPEPPARASAADRLDESRRRQLESDLRLTVEERVMAAERTAREGPGQPFGRLFISFERPEAYHEWKNLEAIGRL